jgi:hypothetical protein
MVLLNQLSLWGGPTHIPILKPKSSNKTPYTRRITIKTYKKNVNYSYESKPIWQMTLWDWGRWQLSLSTTLTIPHPQSRPIISMIRRSQRELVKMMMPHSPWQDQRQLIAYTPILEYHGPLTTFDLATRSTRTSTITIVREPWMGQSLSPITPPPPHTHTHWLYLSCKFQFLYIVYGI